MDTSQRTHRMLPVSVAVVKELPSAASTDDKIVLDAIEECIATLRDAVPELHIDWSSLSLPGRFVSGTAPADQIDLLHHKGLHIGALIDPITEHDVGLDTA